MTLSMETVLLEPGECEIFDLADGRRVAVMAVKPEWTGPGREGGASDPGAEPGDDEPRRVKIKVPTPGRGGVLRLRAESESDAEHLGTLIDDMAASHVLYASYEPHSHAGESRRVILQSPDLVKLVQADDEREVWLGIDASSLDR
jgi:hypothetical protein